jgi:hypothetical protein
VQANDAKRFRDLLRGMGRMYGQEPDALTLDAYWVALKCWSLQDFEAACGQLMQTAKFMPRPAEFNELRKAGEMSPGEAFAIAQEIARNCSPYSEPTSDDPRIDAAARACGGYRAMGMVETSSIGYLEQRFAKHFEDISEREDIREAVPALAGVPHLSPPKALPYDPKQRLE